MQLTAPAKWSAAADLGVGRTTRARDMTSGAETAGSRLRTKRSVISEILAFALVVLLGVGAVLGYQSFVRARDAADGSCLAAVHAALLRADVLSWSREQSNWRLWPEAEVAQALSAAGPFGDCENAADAKWRRSLQVRSRRHPSGQIEAQLWLKDRPAVSSPWGVLHSE